MLNGVAAATIFAAALGGDVHSSKPHDFANLFAKWELVVKGYQRCIFSL